MLYMKVGTHAGEDLESIIARKKLEIEATGFSLWGYGGNTCHPATMVQPFAAASSGPIVLAMQAMNSRHFAPQLRADEYSVDGVTWMAIPDAINVLGSRYALAIGSLELVEKSLDLSMTRVAVGNSKGRRGLDYVKGRVDKACLEVGDAPPDGRGVCAINLEAELVDPFAVFLK